MTEEQLQAMAGFFQSLALLRKVSIVRSDVVFGDIGEFLCTEVFDGLTLVPEKTNEGFDALLRGQKVQIKFSDSLDGKNIDLGDPGKYDVLIVVLGTNSAHRMVGDSDADYLFYRFTSAEVVRHFKVDSGYKLSRTKHFKKSEKQYRLNFERT